MSRGDVSVRPDREPSPGPEGVKRTLPLRPAAVVVVDADRPDETAGRDPGPQATEGEPAQRDSYVGTLIDGRYAVEALLGEGAMGLVYRGRHLAIDKVVAIKVMRADLAGDREASMRFLTEARAASSVGSAHIADVTDFGMLPDGSTFIVMEYLRGITLADLLEAQGRLSLARLLNIATQIAEGLGDAHDAGIIHRDLKPENVFLVSRRGADVAKILDFGIAKMQRCKNRVTRTGQVFGTPHYMSPEQALGRPIDHRADIYALGAMMYEMTTGQVPFDGDNPMAVLSRHLHEPPVPPSQRVAEDVVSPGLEAVVLKCLAKRPEDRYSSAAEVADELRTLSAGGVAPAWTCDTRTHLPQRRRRELRRPSRTTRRQHLRVTAKLGLAAFGFTALVASAVAFVGTRSTGSPATVLRPLFAYGRTTVARIAFRAAPQLDPEFSWGQAAATRAVALLLSPLDAKVFQDEEDLGGMPLTLRVPLGEKLTLVVRRDGYESRTVEIDASQDRQVIKLSKLRDTTEPSKISEAPSASQTTPTQHAESAPDGSQGIKAPAPSADSETSSLPTSSDPAPPPADAEATGRSPQDLPRDPPPPTATEPSPEPPREVLEGGPEIPASAPPPPPPMSPANGEKTTDAS